MLLYGRGVFSICTKKKGVFAIQRVQTAKGDSRITEFRSTAHLSVEESEQENVRMQSSWERSGPVKKKLLTLLRKLSTVIIPKKLIAANPKSIRTFFFLLENNNECHLFFVCREKNKIVRYGLTYAKVSSKRVRGARGCAGGLVRGEDVWL